MANKELTAKVKLDCSDAEEKLRRLHKLITGINKAITGYSNTGKLESSLAKQVIQAEKVKQATLKTEIAQEKLTQEIGKSFIAEEKVNQELLKTEAITQRVKNETTKASTATHSLGNSFNSANSQANKLLTTVKSLAKTYLGVMGMKAIINTSDTITKAQNRLNNIEGGSPEATDATMDKVYSAAQRSRSGYSAMMSNVSKSMALAPDAFQGNIDNAIRFQEIMSKSYTIGGASAAEQSSSMYQLIQALGSGVLQGDELRSVREGAPLAYKEIEKYVQDLMAQSEATKEYATMSLKDIASEGIVTSDMVVAAIMNMETEVNKAFENTSVTFEQAWEGIKNTAIKAFEPTLEMLNQMLNHPVITSLMETFAQLLTFVGAVVNAVFSVLLGLFDWIAENWDWLSKVLLSVATILGGVLLGALILNLMTVGGLVKQYILLGVQAVISAVKSAISWMTLCLPLTIIIAILAAIVIALIWVSDSFADACGIVVGVIMGAISVIWNNFVTLTTLVLKSVLLPMVTAWDNFANFLGNLFNDPIGAIVHGFGNMADVVLSILQTIAAGIDSIFGTELEATVITWREGLASKTDELAEKWGNGTYKEKSALGDWLDEKLTELSTSVLWDTSDAYDLGYDWGNAGGSWLTEQVSGLFDGLPDPTAWDQQIDESLYKPIDNIDTNVAGIKDAMDLSNDDLEFLRAIADMEWRNEFTTATIQVDMTNHNTVNGERDLDGIVEYLSEVLRDEMTNVAYGTHY